MYHLKWCYHLKNAFLDFSKEKKRSIVTNNCKELVSLWKEINRNAVSLGHFTSMGGDNQPTNSVGQSFPTLLGVTCHLSWEGGLGVACHQDSFLTDRSFCYNWIRCLISTDLCYHCSFRPEMVYLAKSLGFPFGIHHFFVCQWSPLVTQQSLFSLADLEVHWLVLALLHGRPAKGSVGKKRKKSNVWCEWCKAVGVIVQSNFRTGYEDEDTFSLNSQPLFGSFPWGHGNETKSGCTFAYSLPNH